MASGHTIGTGLQAPTTEVDDTDRRVRDEGNFGEVCWRAVALYPKKMAIWEGDRCLTYRELEDRTQRAARVLAGLGVGKGDRVMLLLPNDYRFPECVLGILRVGAVVVPGNIRLGIDALAYIAEHSDSTVLIAHAQFAERVKTIRDKAPNLRHVLAIGGYLPDSLSYDAMLDQAEAGFVSVPVDPRQDIAIQLYTSGSTGRPKGVLLTHFSQWAQARTSAQVFHFDAHDIALVMGPLYHANAFWFCLTPMLYVGGALLMLPSFEAEPVLAAIDRYRPTYTSGTPSMYALLLAKLRETGDDYDVSSIELLCCGSAPVPEELMRAITERFRCEVCEVFGLSEAGANIFTPRWGIKKLGSTGLPLPGVEVRIVDLGDESKDCPPGMVGELWSRSALNAVGYYKQLEVTAARFTDDGWMKTGDLMRRDEQGYVYFCGRKDDMISVGGENVYPKEVETILLEHPAIADVGVVPVPHAVKGQAPVAFVVLHEAGSVDEEAVKRYFLARGPAYAHPRRVFFLERLPISGTNKLDRKALIAEARRRIPEPIGS